MPIYDFECKLCGAIYEDIKSVSDEGPYHCMRCNGDAQKIMSVSGANCFNEDAEWIRSIRDVVDPSVGIAQKRFFENPTRENYKSLLSETGFRHVEKGEKVLYSPPKKDTSKIFKDVFMKHRDRMMIEVR